jgi:hypothetical protein
MQTHKFRQYQFVLLDASLNTDLPEGAYMITKKLPERDGEFEYCVKSIHEPYERVVRESQLKKIP